MLSSHVDGMLEMDMVYFSPELDVELAAKLSEKEGVKFIGGH